MKVYYIKNYAKEDMPEMVCSYAYKQFLEVVKSLKRRGINFETWTEEV